MTRMNKAEQAKPSLLSMHMELASRKDLQSCLFAFVPAFMSVPFLFVYLLHRLSVPITIVLIIVLFFAHFVVLGRFFARPVFLRAHFLTFILTMGCLWSFTSPAVGLFTVILAMFHLSEFLSVALWCPRTLAINSFLLNHSPQYHGAIVIAYVEYFLESYFLFPHGMPYQWLWILIGLIMVISGEYLRKLAMYTAQHSFSHLIEDRPDQEHQLVTHGIYQKYRHPSYVGWFWWACGTQIVLGNPLSFVIYLISTWMFFADRIAYEEATLIRHYGGLYRDYQKRVRVGIPFIRGCR